MATPSRSLCRCRAGHPLASPLRRRRRPGTHPALPAEGRRPEVARRSDGVAGSGRPRRAPDGADHRGGVVRQWLVGYRVRRKSTVRQAEVHLKLIKAHFGATPMSSVRPSDVRGWTAMLKAEGRADSYVYALHSRLSQLFTDAVHDGIVARNPCSRRTSPGTGKQRPYVATTEQVWALHDALPAHHPPGHPARRVSPGCGSPRRAVCGSTTSTSCAASSRRRSSGPTEPLKSDISRTPIPIPSELALVLARSGRRRQAASDRCTNAEVAGCPVRGRSSAPSARPVSRCVGLPDGFRFHDLRHYFASLLIASGLDVKVVQARVRHASAQDDARHLRPPVARPRRRLAGRGRRSTRPDRRPPPALSTAD